MSLNQILPGSSTAAIDERCILDGIDSKELMKNAGTSISDAIIDEFADMQKKGLVLSGVGNNGGDGFVCAIALLERGYDVVVFHMNSADKIRGDAKYYFDKLNKTQSAVVHFIDPDSLDSEDLFSKSLKEADFLVDAIFGTGIHGEFIYGIARHIIKMVNEEKSKRKDMMIFSADIPSGIDSDNGAVLGYAIKADVTITFGRKKIGLLHYPGAYYSGKVVVADIGIPAKYYDDEVSFHEPTLEWVTKWIPEKLPWIYKHKAGRLLVIAGSVGFTGAAILTATAAMRSGSGVVTLVCPWELNNIFEIKLTEVMTFPVEQTEEGSIHFESLEEILTEANEYDALAIGPGLSTNPSTVRLVREILKRVKKPTVLDADGLRAITTPTEVDSDEKFDLKHVIITPHPGELANILGKVNIELENRIKANKEVVKKYNIVSVLKGAATIISDTNENNYINTTGDWALATAGTGDILTGIIGSLLAQGMDLTKAAVCGVYIHGLSADLISKKVSKTAMIASDLLDGIKEVFNKIEEIKY